MRNQNCGCGRSSCSSCCNQKKPGPNIPPCACAKAFDDTYIRSVIDTLLAASIAGGGEAAAAAMADLFCPGACFAFFPGGTPRCGREALIAGFLDDQSVLASLTFGITSIERLVNPDCSVTVTVGHTSTFQIVDGPLLCSFDFEIITFAPGTCCIQSYNVVNVGTDLCAPAPAAIAARTARSTRRTRADYYLARVRS